MCRKSKEKERVKRFVPQKNKEKTKKRERERIKTKV